MKLRFLHDSFIDYFCAEGLCEMIRRWEGPTLDRCIADYSGWGPAMRLLLELVEDGEDLQFLINRCQNWQMNVFGLDCLPHLYARLALTLEAEKQPTAASMTQKIFDLVGKDKFLQQKAQRSHFCEPMVEYVRLALKTALDGFRPDEPGPTNYRYLAEVVLSVESGFLHQSGVPWGGRDSRKSIPAPWTC